ncbi:hypothetical protein GCM10009775_14840 [Microbacterium aoyamense]|uniref:Uncharacterized protein n=1 Tax=Microbacterium aoyamense TaxID=344166 RepID=A0ABN2PJL3_9MICO|nr:hypothetical protein [Microbacterium aoyamense]
MTLDDTLSEAIVRYVGQDESSIPGRHPDRVASESTRAHVEQVIAELDAIRPDDSAVDLFGWARREVDALPSAPRLSDSARSALVSLLSFTWR